jgi:type IV pilus assembly protein PilB
MDVLSRLLKNGTLTEDAVQAVAALIDEKGVSYEEALLAQKVPKKTIREAFSEEYGVSSFELSEEDQLEQSVLAYIPEESARHYRIMPLKLEDGVLLVGVNDPENLQVREVLNFISAKHNLPYKLAFVLNEDIEKYLSFYESLTGEVDEALFSFDTESEIPSQVEDEPEDNLSHIKEDAPVTKIVATILRYAVDGNASDIHIEPTGEKVMVRFRVDGLLSKSLELPQNVQSAVVARVKILSSIRLDEKRKPQDGRFSANFDGRKIDFRVSFYLRTSEKRL